jgi:DNA-binding NarL/FixJ family response regulator
MPRLLLLQNDPTVGERLRQAIVAMPGMEVSGLTVTLPHAIRSMQISRPDLVLVDLQLKRSELEAFLEGLCAQPRESRPQVLVGALSLDEPTLMEAIALGADGYYLHGGPTESLRDAIVKVLAGESPMAPAIARRARSMFEAPAWSGAGVGGDALDAAHLSPAQLHMLGRLGEGYLAREVAQELQTTEHAVGLSIRALYRQLQLERRAAATAARLN